jgi:LAGLIDADG endonuclease
LTNKYPTRFARPLFSLAPHDKIPTKHWIIGFVEAEGSFDLVKKDINRTVHAFGITQKKDVHILEQIRSIFHIKAKIKQNSNGAFLLETKNSRSLQLILKYFTNTFDESSGVSNMGTFFCET